MHSICCAAIGLALDHKIVEMCWEQNASKLHTQLFGLVSLVNNHHIKADQTFSSHIV